MPRIAALLMLRSTMKTVFAPAFVAHSHTPGNRCVRFVFGVAAASFVLQGRKAITPGAWLYGG